MERLQIEETYNQACLDAFRDDNKYGRDYYNETYGQTKNEITMKANELRIGNVVNIVNTTKDFLGRVWYSDALISHEDIYDIARGNGYQYNPMPLTEEWLVKFGFKYDTDNDKLCKSLHIDILSFRASEGHMCLESQGYRTLYKHIKYVHQLQNLYFALKGEELEIKK
jgi:hypothetical protein